MKPKNFFIVTLFFLFAFVNINYTAKAQEENDSEIYFFSLLLEKSILNGDSVTISKMFDKEKFMDRIISNDSLKLLYSVDSSTFYSFYESINFPQRIVDQTFNIGSYNLLRSYEINGETHILFRFFNEGEINYHDYLLDFSNNEYKIIDLYVYFTGEYFSQTIYNIIAEAIYEQSGLESNNLINKNNILSIKVLQNLVQTQKFELADKQLKSIPESLQTTKQLMLYKVLISQNISENDFSNTIAEYKKLFHDDPSVFLLSMEGYLFQKRYKDALQSIDSLDYKIGGDDFLDYFRANIYFLTDDFENAEKNLSSLIVNFPDFFQPYQNLFILYVRHNKYSQAVSILENIQMKFNLEKANLIIEIANDFPEFSESPEFEDWKSF